MKQLSVKCVMERVGNRVRGCVEPREQACGTVRELWRTVRDCEELGVKLCRKWGLLYGELGKCGTGRNRENSVGLREALFMTVASEELLKRRRKFVD